MTPLSVRVSESNQAFLTTMIDRGTSKSELVNHALDLLRKIQLQKELTELASDDFDENAQLANLDMNDYLDLLDHAL